MDDLRLMKNGHSLSIIKQEGIYFAYKGNVLWEGIDLYAGESLDDLRLMKKGILKDRHWASVVHYKDKIIMFCTSTSGKGEKIWQNQEILRYESTNGRDFKFIDSLGPGDNPFITRFKNRYYFYWHRKNAGHHQIWASSMFNPGGKLGKAKLIKEEETGITMAAPSVISHDGTYCMTLEIRSSAKQWHTILLKSDKPMGEYEHVKTILEPIQACALLHNIDDQQFMTYSRRREHKNWGLYLRENIDGIIG